MRAHPRAHLLTLAGALALLSAPPSVSAQDRTVSATERDRMVELIRGGASAATVQEAWSRLRDGKLALPAREAASAAGDILQRGTVPLVAPPLDRVSEAMAVLDAAVHRLGEAQAACRALLAALEDAQRLRPEAPPSGAGAEVVQAYHQALESWNKRIEELQRSIEACQAEVNRAQRALDQAESELPAAQLRDASRSLADAVTRAREITRVFLADLRR